MNSTLFCILFSIFFSLFTFKSGLCLDSEDIIKLKKAGISDDTIGVMIAEKTVETCAFSIKEIVELRKAGMSDKSIQKLIINGSFMKDSDPVIYGESTRSITTITPKEIRGLKDAGVSDEVIRAVISGRNNEETDKAWSIIKDMGIVIDKREGNGQEDD